MRVIGTCSRRVSDHSCALLSSHSCLSTSHAHASKNNNTTIFFGLEEKEVVFLEKESTLSKPASHIPTGVAGANGCAGVVVVVCGGGGDSRIGIELGLECRKTREERGFRGDVCAGRKSRRNPMRRALS